MMEMEPEKRLGELIQLFHKEKVVETLVEAQRKGGFIELQTAYAEEKKKFFIKLRLWIGVAPYSLSAAICFAVP